MIDELILPLNDPYTVPAMRRSPPMPTPPVTTNAPVDDDDDTVESANNILPLTAYKAYALVSVPPVGAFAIVIVAAVVPVPDTVGESK